MTDRHNEIATPGGRVGSRLARLIADAVVFTRQRLAGTQSAVAQEVFTTATNHISDEVRAAMGDVFARIADDPQLPAELQPLFHHLARTRGQAFGWIGGAVTGAAVGNVLIALINNHLNPVTSNIIALAPGMHLAPDSAASAGARGIVTHEEASREIRFSGFGKGREETLQMLAENHLTTAEVIELLRRDQIGAETARFVLRRNGIPDAEVGMLLTLERALLTPEQAATGWGRQLVSDEDLQSTAKAFGLTREDAEVLKGLAGEPPNLETLILAWRRGILTESDVDRGIVQGPIRNEWIAAVKALQEEPLSLSEAASAVTQGHLTHDRALSKARLHGITPEDFTVMVENSGIPPGLDFATEALNRGIITEEQFVSMFLESRIKNRYVELMLAMRRRLIPAETVRLAYRYREYPLEQAVETLMGHGYSDPDARALLALEDARAREGTKDLSRSQILDLYGEDVLDREQTSGMLAALGFDEVEVEWMLTLEDGSQVKRFVNMIETRVRNAYVSGNIDDTQAATLLDRAGVGERRRDNLLSLWDIERESVSRQLTVAQIQQALRRNIITDGEARDRFTAMGFTETDADIIIRLTTGG